MPNPRTQDGKMDVDVDEVLELFEDIPFCLPLYTFYQQLKTLLGACTCGVHKRIEKCLLQRLASARCSFLHFITIELAGIYLFAYTEYNTIFKLLAEFKEKYTADDADKVDVQGRTITWVQDCYNDVARSELWLQASHDFHRCHQNITKNSADMGPTAYRTYHFVFGMMNVGCCVACFLMYVGCVYLLFQKMGCACKTIGAGDYLQFCYQLPRSKFYRFFGNVIATLTVICIVVIVVLVCMIGASGGLVWIVQTIGVDFVVLVVLAMGVVRPPRPTFQCHTKAFRNVQFKLPQFYITSVGFAKRLERAIVLAQAKKDGKGGGYKCLKELLQTPEDCRTVFNLLCTLRPKANDLQLNGMLKPIKKALEVFEEAQDEEAQED